MLIEKFTGKKYQKVTEKKLTKSSRKVIKSSRKTRKKLPWNCWRLRAECLGFRAVERRWGNQGPANRIDRGPSSRWTPCSL